MLDIVMQSFRSMEEFKGCWLVPNEGERHHNLLTDKEYRELEEITGKHIVDEKKALSALDKIMPEVKSDKIRFLLESIAADEKKHHELLEKLVDLIVKKEAILEEDWWEILWKNVPFHGAPGG